MIRINICTISHVPSDFARYLARWKRYAYYVCSDSGGGWLLPFAWSRHSWRVNVMVNAAVMMSTGKHNFEWMCVVQRWDVCSPARRDAGYASDSEPDCVQGATYDIDVKHDNEC
jgi:tRNA U38,U39,U40 pseudouridine synthase TruA